MCLSVQPKDQEKQVNGDAPSHRPSLERSPSITPITPPPRIHRAFSMEEKYGLKPGACTQ